MATPDRNKKRHHLTPAEAILESISAGVFTVDMDWIVTSFNRAAEQITGVPRHLQEVARLPIFLNNNRKSKELRPCVNVHGNKHGHR